MAIGLGVWLLERRRNKRPISEVPANGLALRSDHTMNHRFQSVIAGEYFAATKAGGNYESVYDMTLTREPQVHELSGESIDREKTEKTPSSSQVYRSDQDTVG